MGETKHGICGQVKMRKHKGKHDFLWSNCIFIFLLWYLDFRQYECFIFRFQEAVTTFEPLFGKPSSSLNHRGSECFTIEGVSCQFLIVSSLIEEVPQCFLANRGSFLNVSSLMEDLPQCFLTNGGTFLKVSSLMEEPSSKFPH